VACDSLSALTRAHSDHPTLPTEPHYDFISAIQHLRMVLLVQVEFQHICGHQDKGIPMVLDWTATLLNIAMDEQAKSKLAEYMGPMLAKSKLVEYMGPMQYTSIPFETWSCTLPGGRITNQLHHRLWEHINGLCLLQFWAQNQCFQVESPSRIAYTLQKWVTQFELGVFAHRKNRACWKFQTVTKSPCCDNPSEDKIHVLHCKAPGVQQMWTHARVATRQQDKSHHSYGNYQWFTGMEYRDNTQYQPNQPGIC